MPGALKLAIVASMYGNPYKWVVRTLATPTTCITSPSIMPINQTKPFSSFALNSKGEKISAGWRIAPCAPSAQARNKSERGLFGGHKSLASSSVNTPESRSEGGGGGGEERGPLGPLPQTDTMGAEHDHEWPHNHHHRQQQQSPQQQQHQQQMQHQQPFKLLTLPTILTLGRVAAVPLLVSTFYVDGWWGTTATTSIFIAAAITDWLDGYIARKMRLGTVFGAFLDPVADKLMVAATLVLLCSRPMDVDVFGQAPWLLTVPSIAIIGREITMSAVREWAAAQNSKLSEAVAVNNLGKWKTATQMTALTILLATRDSSLAGPGILVGSGVVLLYVSAGLAVWSLVVYMRKIWKVLLK